MIEEFFHVRLDLYAQRRELMLQRLLAEQELLENKMRFIDMFIASELEVTSRSKVELLRELVRLKFAPHSSFALALGNAGAEAGSASQQAGAPNTPRAREYDYLLRMPLWTLTSDAVASMREDLQAKSGEHTRVYGLEKSEMWRAELLELRTALKRLY